MLDLESKTYTNLALQQEIYASTSYVSIQNTNKVKTQLKKSDGSLTPVIDLKKDEALVKFNDDTLVYFIRSNTDMYNGIRIMPNQTLFETLKTLLSPEIIMEDGDFLEISISNPPHLLLKNYKDTKISYSNAIGNLVENKRNVDLFLKASDIMEKLIPYRLNSLTRSCSLVINSRPKETTAFVQDKDVFFNWASKL